MLGKSCHGHGGIAGVSGGVGAWGHDGPVAELAADGRTRRDVGAVGSGRATATGARGDAFATSRRLGVLRPGPANKLSEEERAEVRRFVNEPRFASFPPTQIVPILADEDRYLTSESSFYRLLREADRLAHRGCCRPPSRRAVPRHPAPERVLLVGHHLPTGADSRHVLLPRPRARCLLGEDRGARSAHGGSKRTRRKFDRVGSAPGRRAPGYPHRAPG